MGDKRGVEVPKYKLTKEQKDFVKSFKDRLKIKYFLDSETAKLANQMNDLRELYKSLGQSFKGLQPPKEPVHELDGMNFQDEGQQPQEQQPQGQQNPNYEIQW